VQNINLTLIGTSHCHLCEEATIIIEQVIDKLAAKDVSFTMNQIDIINNQLFYELYAQKIPVLSIEKSQFDKIILWPFTTEELIDLLS